MHGGVMIDAPPEDVLKLRSKYAHHRTPVFLVVFYDTKRTWSVHYCIVHVCVIIQ